MNTKITIRQLLVAVWLFLVPVMMFVGFVAGRSGFAAHRMAPVLFVTVLLSVAVVVTFFCGEGS